MLQRLLSGDARVRVEVEQLGEQVVRQGREHTLRHVKLTVALTQTPVLLTDPGQAVRTLGLAGV